jgi:PTS system mannose-specific IIA component
MIPVLVLSHGDLARELLTAARKIDTHLEAGTAAMCLPWDVNADDAAKRLKSELRKLDNGEGILILTDMFGGTATNLALPYLEPDHVEVVTGANLPMLVKLASMREQQISLHHLAEGLAAAGQKSIRMASEFLRHKNP